MRVCVASGKAAEGKGADDEPIHRAGAGAGVGAGSGGNGGASMHTAEATALKFANAGDLLEIVVRSFASRAAPTTVRQLVRDSGEAREAGAPEYQPNQPHSLAEDSGAQA